MITLILDEFPFSISIPEKNKMSFIYLKLRGRERTYIKEKVKYMCAKILYDPADMTAVRNDIWEMLLRNIWQGIVLRMESFRQAAIFQKVRKEV